MVRLINPSSSYERQALIESADFKNVDHTLLKAANRMPLLSQ